MNYDVKEKVDLYLKDHKLMTLATATTDGKPMAHTVDYVNDGATVYFMTEKTTRKANNIMSNSSVFFTVDEDITDLSACQAIQMAGQASLVTDKEEAQKAMGMLVEKIPQLSQLPPNPNMVMFKINLSEGHFIDNTVNMGHRTSVEY